MRTHTLLLGTPLLVATALLTVPAVASAQQSAPAPRSLTAADYAHAEQFLGYNTTPLVLGAAVRPTWVGSDDRFTYRTAIPEGFEFLLVNPARRTRGRAFDHVRLAAALSAAAETTYDALHLPFTQIDLSADGRTLAFDVGP